MTSRFSSPLQFVVILALAAYAIVLTLHATDRNSANHNLKKQLEVDRNDMDFREKTEGRYLWDVLNMDPTRFREGAGCDMYSFVVVLDSLACMGCYEYHVKKMKQLSDTFGLPIQVVSDAYYEFMQKDISYLRRIHDRTGHDLSHSDRVQMQFAVFLIDDLWRIIYSNLPDPADKHPSEVFYAISAELTSRMPRN